MQMESSVNAQDHLDAMFAPSAEPLAWDASNSYTREKLELYYMSHAATPLSLDQLTEVRYLCFHRR